jgi:DNA-binding NtrC family response regulator
MHMGTRGRPVILVLEEDVALRHRLRQSLSSEGFDVVHPTDVTEALRATGAPAPVLAIVGSSSGESRSALDIAQRIRRSRAGLPVILITARSSEQLAIAALKMGINDYFTHPVSLDDVTASVRRCLAPSPARAWSREHGVPAIVPRMVGDSARMREIHDYIERVAGTESTVLITGETGTGKDLTAALIHQASRRRSKPLVQINCAAIPETLLESELFGYERGAFTGAHASNAGKVMLADGGTVLFDEIGDMSIHAQAKILRLLESGEIERLGGRRSVPVDVRVIAVTNQDLDRLMLDGRFRKDLYFRLNVARIHLPPLRERKEDITSLLDHYVGEFSRAVGREVVGVADDVLAALHRHDWPGNIRELRNLVEAIFLTLRSSRITALDLPGPYRRPGDAGEIRSAAEREQLLAALAATSWNKSRTAEQLQWSRMTVYRKMAKYHLIKSSSTADNTSSHCPAAVTTAAAV